MEVEDASDFRTEANRLLCSGLGTVASLHHMQEQCLDLLLQNKNVLYIDRTGGGKSATYFIATKLLRQQNPLFGPTFVISPLVALMNDQVKNARRFGLVAATINSHSVDTIATRKKIGNNELDILFLTAEMLQSNNFLRHFPQLHSNYEQDDEDTWTHIPLLVIDEAHCVSDWGHDFRAAYFTGMKTVMRSEWTRKTLKLATSATVPQRVETDLIQILEDFDILRGDLFRDNLSIRLIYGAVSNNDKVIWLKKYIKKNPDHNVLIFAQFKKELQNIVSSLKADSICVAGYCADTEDREEVENKFQTGEIKVLVATIALGMGFDKADIHTVIHTYTPSSPVQYYQEIGRAGRKLPSAWAYLLPCSPWRNDTARDVAMRRIFDFLGNGPMSRDDLARAAESDNVKNQHILDALNVGITKGFFQDVGRISILNPRTEEEMACHNQYITERKLEMEFMRKLTDMNEQECVWVKLLLFLNQNLSPGFRCESCSRCSPKGRGDIRATQTPQYWKQSTPEFNIPVYSISLCQSNFALDIEMVKALLGKTEPDLAADPPSWMLTYIPNKTKDNNREVFSYFSQELSLESFDFIRVNPLSRSMTAANTLEVRRQIIRDKFHFNEKQLPPPHYNILIYDDAVKSGLTMDCVAAVLLKQNPNRKILAIVNTIWNGGDLPDPESFFL